MEKMERVTVLAGLFICLASLIYEAEATCVLESDFGFTINCAFKKSGLFRVRNLGGIKAHVGLGFSVGDELGFGQSLTNLDPSRRRSVSVKSGAPPNAIGELAPATVKQEKRGKQNRLIVRQPSPNPPPQMSGPGSANTANLAAVKAAMANLQRRAHNPTTMQPIIVPSGPSVDTPMTRPNPVPKLTIAKPLPMSVPPFRPLPPKDEAPLRVLPISTTRKTPQVSQAKGPGLAYSSENYIPRITHDQVSKMVSQMTASQVRFPQNQPSNMVRITPAPIVVENFPSYSPSTQAHIPAFQALPNNRFVPMPVAATPVQISGISIVPAPVLTKYSPNHSMASTTLSYAPTSLAVKQPAPYSYPSSNFVEPDPHGVNHLASQIYPVYSQSPTKKLDDYNSISGYGDESPYKFSKDDLNTKITQIAQAANISMEAVEAAILLRQQQILNQYANIPIPTTTSTTTTAAPPTYRPEPTKINPVTQKQKRYPMAAGSAKVMNAPREYYPIGYEKNFDDQFESKVELPETSFYCGDQKYFPGLYGDENLGCMVFHVCALTDDGLVMKSFLCPESTLFDQTILKCNWWFYVDCASSRRLYDTNIPVSKSYQLMKALTFFSSYKKDSDGARVQNPEDIDGIKEAIAILENQDTPKTTQPDNVQIVTGKPVISSRPSIIRVSSAKYNGTSNHRMDREYKTNSSKTSSQSNGNSSIEDSHTSGSQNIETVVKKAASSKSETVSVEVSSRESSSSKERHVRRRQNVYALRGRTSTTTAKPKLTTTVAKIEVTTKKIEVTTPKTEPQIYEIEKETDTNDYETRNETNYFVIKNETSNYESTSVKTVEVPIVNEENKETFKPDKELSMVKNEKVQIVRPTPVSELVGQFPTPTATIAALDQAILGTDGNSDAPKLSVAQPTSATLRASYTIDNSNAHQDST